MGYRTSGTFKQRQPPHRARHAKTKRAGRKRPNNKLRVGLDYAQRVLAERRRVDRQYRHKRKLSPADRFLKSTGPEQGKPSYQTRPPVESVEAEHGHGSDGLTEAGPVQTRYDPETVAEAAKRYCLAHDCPRDHFLGSCGLKRDYCLGSGGYPIFKEGALEDSEFIRKVEATGFL